MRSAGGSPFKVHPHGSGRAIDARGGYYHAHRRADICALERYATGAALSLGAVISPAAAVMDNDPERLPRAGAPITEPEA